MKFRITGRKIDVTEGLKDKVTKKLSKLDKFFNEDSDADVRLIAEKNRHTVEVTIYQKGFIFRAEETNSDMYVAIDKIIDVLERQIRKNKTKISKRIIESAFENPISDSMAAKEQEETELKILKTKRFDIKPMSAEEAILQMNMLGHTFFVFTNADSGAVNVVYKRKDGNYGLLDATQA